MNSQKINYLLETLRMVEDVERPDPNNPNVYVMRREPVVKGEQRTELINELVEELTKTDEDGTEEV